MNDVIAVLPARKFDYNLENKNLLPFLDTNLLSHKIKQLQRVSSISNIVVCSDSDELLDIAKGHGVDVYKRPNLPQDIDTFSNLIEIVLDKRHEENILWTNCCTPFVDEKLYADSIDVYFKKLNEDYDSLISVLPFKKFVIDDNGPLNFHRGIKHKDSCNLNQLYFWISAIAIASKENMLKWKYSWGNIPYKYILDKKAALEIKSIEDLKIAELYQNGGCFSE